MVADDRAPAIDHRTSFVNSVISVPFAQRVPHPQVGPGVRIRFPPAASQHKLLAARVGAAGLSRMARSARAGRRSCCSGRSCFRSPKPLG
jgi:hypothetical protein